MIVLPRTRSQNGIIPNAATVLTKVIVIDRLISPLSRRHQKFDPVPPGQQPRTLEIIIIFIKLPNLFVLELTYIRQHTEWNSAQKLKKIALANVCLSAPLLKKFQ